MGPGSAPEASARAGSLPKPRAAPGGRAGSGGTRSSSTESDKETFMLFLLPIFAAVSFSPDGPRRILLNKDNKKIPKMEKKKKKKKKSEKGKKKKKKKKKKS